MFVYGDAINSMTTMSDENNETTTEEIVDAAEEAEEAEPTDVEEADETSIDHKAELEREREARKKAETALAEKRFKSKERNEVVEEDDEDTDTVTKKDLDNLRNSLLNSQQEDKIEKAAQAISNSPEEAEHVRDVYLNRITPTGNLEEDMEAAYAIANRKKLISENKEIKRAALARNNTSTGAAGSVKNREASETSAVSPADKAFLKKSGFVWDGKKRGYYKESTGMLFDPKTQTSQRV